MESQGGRSVSRSPLRPLRRLLELDRKRARWAALYWGLFLFALTSWPRPPEVPIVSGIPNFDKLVHSTLYAIEAYLIYRSLRWPGVPGFSWMRVVTIVGAMAVWGMADETHQAWIPGRSMESGDVGADVAGSAVGAAVASAISGRRPRRLLSA